MIVKWTTIAEDESTWPPNHVLVYVDRGDMSPQFVKREDEYDDNGDFFKRRVGQQWRPMPKPSKKKKVDPQWIRITYDRTTWPKEGLFFSKSPIGQECLMTRYGLHVLYKGTIINMVSMYGYEWRQ
jgi:hypothetical protein